MFFLKFIMIRLLSRHHPAANPFPPFPLCLAAGQRGRGGEGLAEAQLPHIFQDGVSPFAPGLTQRAVGSSPLADQRRPWQVPQLRQLIVQKHSRGFIVKQTYLFSKSAYIHHVKSQYLKMNSGDLEALWEDRIGHSS